tara:strand:+ start:2115 stop:2513 length:399 start_codon:yes stop_codon:yes gene_type:complete
MRIAQIKKRSDFLRIAAKNHTWASPGLVLQVDRNNLHTSPNDSVLRIGYTASRRVGGAVKRNRAKRRLRATVARVMPFHAKVGYDYVLIARAKTNDRNFSELSEDLFKALEKTGTSRKYIDINMKKSHEGSQ